jgi:hypothetical protein
MGEKKLASIVPLRINRIWPKYTDVKRKEDKKKKISEFTWPSN